MCCAQVCDGYSILRQSEENQHFQSVSEILCYVRTLYSTMTMHCSVSHSQSITWQACWLRGTRRARSLANFNCAYSVCQFLCGLQIALIWPRSKGCMSVIMRNLLMYQVREEFVSFTRLHVAHCDWTLRFGCSEAFPWQRPCAAERNQCQAY